MPYTLLAYTLKKYAAPTLRLVTFMVTWAPTFLGNGKDWFTYKLVSVDTTRIINDPVAPAPEAVILIVNTAQVGPMAEMVADLGAGGIPGNTADVGKQRSDTHIPTPITFSNGNLATST